MRGLYTVRACVRRVRVRTIRVRACEPPTDRRARERACVRERVLIHCVGASAILRDSPSSNTIKINNTQQRSCSSGQRIGLWLSSQQQRFRRLVAIMSVRIVVVDARPSYGRNCFACTTVVAPSSSRCPPRCSSAGISSPVPVAAAVFVWRPSRRRRRRRRTGREMSNEKWLTPAIRPTAPAWRIATQTSSPWSVTTRRPVLVSYCYLIVLDRWISSCLSPGPPHPSPPLSTVAPHRSLGEIPRSLQVAGPAARSWPFAGDRCGLWLRRSHLPVAGDPSQGTNCPYTRFFQMRISRWPI